MVKTVGFLLVLSMTFPANTGSAQSCSQDAAIRNRPAAVFIRVKKTLKATGQVQERTGTGFLISRSGYVLTNRHVIEADETVDEIEISGFIASREAVPSRLTVIARNEHDVALLKFADTSKTYATVTLGRPSDVKVGTELCSVSFPKNQEYYFSSGPMSGFGAERGFWLTQMASNPGDSGAPVFTASGEVVAIKFGGYGDMQNVNLLIPMNLAQDLLILVPDLDTGSESQSHNHASQSNEQGCDSFLKFQGDESALALLGEKAFAQQKYECVITYLEQAKKVELSKVWERDYPFLAAAYLLARKDRPRFEAVLQDMLSEMRLPDSYLHHGSPIGMALRNLTEVRQYLDSEAQSYIDRTVIPAAVEIKQNLGS